MASIFLGSTLMPSRVSLCPRNLQSVNLNCIFLEFKDRLFSVAVLHSTRIVPLCVLSVAPCITMSSVIPSTAGTSLITLSSLSWKTSPETFKPNGILSHLYLPHRVLNVVRRLLLKSKGMCQNPDVASFTAKYLDCASSGRMSSRVLAYHWFLLIALFKYFGSKHSLRLPSSFITDTMELIHSVCSCTSVMMPSFTSLSNSVCRQTAFPIALIWVGAGLVYKSLLTLCDMGHLVEF